MPGKLVFTAFAGILACGVWKCVPLGAPPAPEHADKPAWLTADMPLEVNEAARVQQALAALEGDVSERGISIVQESLAVLDGALVQLAARVQRTAGGERADAEIRRIELQRLRDDAVAQLAAARAQLRAAHLELSTQSFDLRSLSSLRRVRMSGCEWRDSVRLASASGAQRRRSFEGGEHQHQMDPGADDR